MLYSGSNQLSTKPEVAISLNTSQENKVLLAPIIDNARHIIG